MKTATSLQWNERLGLQTLTQWRWPFGKEASFDVSPAVIPDSSMSHGHTQAIFRQKRLTFHLVKALRYALLVPVLPLVGYFAFDATGLTSLMIGHNTMLTRIIGEGFGHAGMCFSLHYVFQSGKHLWKSLQLL